MRLLFEVYGVAVPKGNMKPFMITSKATGMKFPILTESNRNVKSWSQLVAQGASLAINELPEEDRRPLDAGVRLTMQFYLPRPKKYQRAGVEPAHLTNPDLDKLVRAIKDALTKVAYVDDSQVVELLATKQYAEMDKPPRVRICVESTAGCRPVVVPPAPMPLLEDLLNG